MNLLHSSLCWCVPRAYQEVGGCLLLPLLPPLSVLSPLLCPELVSPLPLFTPSSCPPPPQALQMDSTKAVQAVQAPPLRLPAQAGHVGQAGRA